jgi:hypothetical protein
MDKQVVEYRITRHGAEHGQYFQGHGISHSRFTDCATGIGQSEWEAFDDALEQLAQNGWDVELIGKDDEAHEMQRNETRDFNELQHGEDWEGSEVQYFVSVDVRSEGDPMGEYLEGSATEFRLKGTSRRIGSIGFPEEFSVCLYAKSKEEAAEQLRDRFYGKLKRENVHITSIVAVQHL